ncbi:MAG: hypothetical protein F4017_06825 [Acidimicrobiaceae bacterium]|nr:hypothetical protein [Acidimicrobiaceae bacterium]MYK74289.1 hypothetical protein [Acidimicrobiaceae bacterium]
MDGDVHGPAAARDPEPATRESTWLQRREEVAGLILVLAGLGLVIIHYLGGSERLPNAELGALAFGAPYSTLGLLAMLGGRSGRPALMATSSMPLMFMCMVSWVTILLVPIAVFLFVRGAIGLGAGRQRHLGWEELCLSSVLPAALVLAFGCLLFHQDPVSWRSGEHSFASTSDHVTVFESALSLGAVVLSVAVSVFWIVLERDRKRSSNQV